MTWNLEAGTLETQICVSLPKAAYSVKMQTDEIHDEKSKP